MKRILLFICLTISATCFSQVKGTVTDTNNQPLSSVSVYLSGTVTGTTTNDNGSYELDIKKAGKYSIVFQFLGYRTITKDVTINQFPYLLNITLEEEQVLLDEISINTKENPANVIIKKAINAKEENTNKFQNFTAKFYSKGLFRVKNAPEKFFGQSVGDLGGGLDSTRSGIVYLSETISEITSQKKPKSFKEKIIASKVSGSDNGISFNRAEQARFDIYQNLMNIGDSKMISPIANDAFSHYTYKLSGSFYDKNNNLINKIKVTPKRNNEKVFSGYIYIVENSWAVYGSNLTATGKQLGVPVIKELSFKQDYNYSKENEAWVLISQTIDFGFSFFGFNVDGNFSSAYSNYNFSPVFNDTTFSNEVLSFAKNATEKDSLYWKTIRPVPLTKEEISDYSLKDSIKTIRKSKSFLDSLDQKNNKFYPLSLVTGYTYNNSYNKWNLTFSSPLADLSFNTVQGWNASTKLTYSKQLNEKGNRWSLGASFNYGLSDERFRPEIFYSKQWNNIQRNRLLVSGGVTTEQFNGRNPLTKLRNTISSLFWKKNYLKIYEKAYTRIQYSEEVINGLWMQSSLEYANRKPLFNTTNYTIIGKDYPYKSNNPLDESDFSASFIEHTIWIATVDAVINFGQKYLSYPDAKFNIGNDDYPTLYLQYRKTFGADTENLESDAVLARIKQDISLGALGLFRYNVRSGIFLEKKDIAFMDYFHPNGNKMRFMDVPNYISQFGLLDYYTHSSNDRYAEAHLEHNFKGFLLSKIPLINKLNFHLVTNTRGLFTSNRKPYFEYSIGLDNIGLGKWRFLRVDYVRSTYGNVQKSDFLFGLTILD